jgi:hypothetical protein
MGARAGTVTVVGTGGTGRSGVGGSRGGKGGDAAAADGATGSHGSEKSRPRGSGRTGGAHLGLCHHDKSIYFQSFFRPFLSNEVTGGETRRLESCKTSDVVFQDGELIQFDVYGTHQQLTTGIVSASVAIVSGQEVLEVVALDGTLKQYDGAGAHQLATGVRTASVAFGPAGAVLGPTFGPTVGEVLDVVFADGSLFQFDFAGTSDGEGCHIDGHGPDPRGAAGA